MQPDEKENPLDALRAADAPRAHPFEFLAHLHRQREFSERTFGPGARTKGVIDHIRKELREIEADPSDISEWIDVTILALDGAWRAGYQPQQIIDALVAKQSKNEARAWPDWRTLSADVAIEHDRSVEVAVSRSHPSEDMETLATVVLRPSQIAGVGCFTTVPIQRDVTVCLGLDDDWLEIPGDGSELPPALWHYIVVLQRSYYRPRDFRCMSVGWYLNHSDTPNVAIDETEDRWFALRDIAADEELTCDYRTLGDGDGANWSPELGVSRPHPETPSATTEKEEGESRVDGVPSDRPLGSTASSHEAK